MDNALSPRRERDIPHIAIVGGGITGLSAAYELEKVARDGGRPVGYTIVEESPRLGGKIVTERVEAGGQFLVEGGPDSFVAQKPWALELARELGLGDQIMGANHARHSTYVLLRGRPRPMPEGLMLVVPTRMVPFALSPLISPLGKLRMGLDLLIPPRRDAADESLGSFIRRRLGREALDKLAEPLMGGIHSADAERQSLLATFPRFRDIELKHGSLIRGMLAQRASRSQGPRTGEIGSGARSSTHGASPFMTLRGGIGALVDALVARLEGEVLLGRGVVGIEGDPAAEQGYRLMLDDGSILEADAVILTTPTYSAAHLVEPLRPELADELRAIRYVSTATITLAYRENEARLPIEGFGLVIPRAEPSEINAVTVTSRKFGHRAPEGYLLLRAFAGGSRNPEVLRHDDDELLALVRRELRAFLHIEAEPLFSRVYRWNDANPQYEVGHLEWADRIERLSPEGLYLAGGAYRGVGIPDCVRHGRDVARRAVARVEPAAVPV